jgi:gluconokinase
VTIVVVMGVAGVGKTTVGRRLAASLGWEFHDADDFHSPASVAKMHAGVPLTEADRAAWLARLRALVEQLARDGRSAVLACSALRRAHREQLTPPGADVRFVHLTGDPALIRARLAARRGHFMPAALLDSQLATLEPPDDAVTVDVTPPVDEIVATIRAALARQPA